MGFKTNTLMLGLTLGLTVSCGAFQTKSKGQKFKQTDSALAERWKSDCVAGPLMELSHTMKDYRFSALGDYDRREYFYKDADCSTKLLTYQQTGVYQALGDQPAVDGAKQINYTMNAASFTPQTQEAADMLNATKFCGLDQWQAGQETDVTGRECAGLKFSKGDVIYGNYQVADDHILYLGSNAMFTSGIRLNERPNSLNKDIPLREQG